MAIEYDDIQLKITSKLDSAKGIDKAIENLDKATDSVDDFAKAVDSVNPGTLELARQAINRMKPIRASSLKGQITKGREVNLEGTYTSSATAWEEVAESTEKASRNLAYYKQLVDEIKDSKAAQEAVTNEWIEIGKAIDKDISKAFQFAEAIDNVKDAVSGIVGGVKNVLSPLTRVVSGLSSLVKRFISITIYRAIRAVLSFITNSFKEGVKNLEEWDRAVGHTGFADSMDRARESLLVLKNALAVIVAPGLEWLIGVLQKVATWAITAANAISRFFAILGNKGTYRAVVWAETLADSESKAGGAAKKATKEFEKQLMAFDEINNLTAQNDGGSGGGGGSGSSAKYSDMFKEMDVGDLSDAEKRWQNFADAIKKGAEETQRSLNQRAEEFKRMWKNLFTDTGQWWDDWTKKLNVSWQVVTNNLGHITQAYLKIQEGDYKGAFDEIGQIFTGSMHEYEVAVQLYGKEWADTHYGIRQDFDTTAKQWDAKLQGLTKATREQTAQQGKHIRDNVTKNLEEATKQGDETKGVFKRISDFAKKWLLPANINDPLTTPLANAKANAEGTKGALEGIGGKTFKPTIPLQGLTDAENKAVGLKDALDDVEGTYNVTINTTESVTRTVEEIISKTNNGRTLTMNAKGGLVNSGQMFIAREAGPELVGTIGTHTAVANNDQIVSAVAQGVASAVSSVLGGQNTNVSVTLEGDAKGLFKVVQKEGRAYSARTGQPALA